MKKKYNVHWIIFEIILLILFCLWVSAGKAFPSSSKFVNIDMTGYLTAETISATSMKANTLSLTGNLTIDANVYTLTSAEGFVVKGDDNIYYKIKVKSGAITVEAL